MTGSLGKIDFEEIIRILLLLIKNNGTKVGNILCYCLYDYSAWKLSKDYSIQQTYAVAHFSSVYYSNENNNLVN